MEVSLGKPPGNRFPFPYISVLHWLLYMISNSYRCCCPISGGVVVGVHRLNRKSMHLGRQLSTGGCHVNVHGIKCRGVEVI